MLLRLFQMQNYDCASSVKCARNRCENTLHLSALCDLCEFLYRGAPPMFCQVIDITYQKRIMHIIQLVIETKALFLHGTVVGWAPSQVPSSRQESAYHEPIRLLIVKY